MMEEQSNSTTVTSLGNSWVMCKSKSRPGYNYYFNTLNGQTLWNLGDAEIEKAKQNTEFLEGQLGNKLEHFPEPKDKPIHGFTRRTSESPASSKIYNKQIINNQFPRHQFAIQPAANTGAFFNAMNALNVISIPTQQTFNPFIWDQHPTQQFFITPAVHPLTNQVQASVISQTQSPYNAFAYKNVQQNLPEQCLPVYRNIQPVRGIRKPRVNNWNNQFRRRQGPPGQKQPLAYKKNDLRQRLHTKRFLNKMSNVDNEETDYNFVDEPANQSDCDETSWNASGVEYFQEQSTKIDMTPLRNLCPPDAKLNSWYIVADTTVILKNFNYLNNLTDSDDSCHLMVPKYVMSQLWVTARDTEHVDVHARRIVRFLTQQIDAGYAFIADDLFYGTGNETADLLNTCLKLVQQSYHVVLISDNKKILESQNTARIPIYTIEELNQMLTRAIYKAHNKTKKVPERMIKITVANNDILNTSRSKHSVVVSESSKENITKKETMTSEIPNRNEIDMTIGTSAPALVKPTVETAVQTDSLVQRSNDTFNNKTTIKLKRSTSYQHSLDNDINCDVKRYKWRNKIKSATVVTQTNKPLPSSGSTNSSNSDQQIHQLSKERLHDSTVDTNNVNIIKEQSVNLSCITSKSSCHDMSGSNIENKNVSSRIAIENTPTKEVRMQLKINNDTANMYEEVIVNPRTSYIIGNKKNAILKNVMFEIADKAMEEYLTMRRDEWVSRFVQIMEEVLTQVLERDPPFTSKEFPPPWILHEATQCVIKKFSNCCYVVDAANKLSIVLCGVSDSGGKLTANMRPSEFMEMYSYGVYLVESLMDLCHDCEDLRTAADSLKRILIDIRNPNIDCVHNDSFIEGLQESGLDVTTTKIYAVENECRTDIRSMQDEASEQQQDYVMENTSPEKFHLRSSISDQQQDNPQEVVKKKKKISSLALQTKEEEAWDSKIKQNSLQGSIDQFDGTDPAEDIADKMETIIHEPRVIRQFQRCSIFEERLRKRKESYDLEYESDENCYLEHSNEEEIIEPDLTYEHFKTENDVESVGTDADDHKIFKHFIGTLSKRIIETFRETKIFCEKSIAILKVPNQSKIIKLDVGRNAEKACIGIIALSKSLDSILKRETDDHENNIGILIKRAGINMSIDQNLLAEYREFVTTFNNQAAELQALIKLIITAAYS